MDETPEQEDDLYFYENEEKDVEIFQKLVTPHYTPCNNPLAMAVGATMPTEKSAIKIYNKRQFGIPLENTRVAMTNINKMPPGRDIPRFQYDHSSFGLMGDARLSTCYMNALDAFNGFERNFDLVYIINPDLIDNSKWLYVFARALECTASEGGVTVTLIREKDVQKYDNLLSLLKREFNIEPIFSGKTNICVNRGYSCFSEDFHHTIGIFKPRS